MKNVKSVVLFLMLLLLGFSVYAEDRNFYQPLGYYEQGQWVGVRGSPAQVCNDYASIWGWNKNGHTYTLDRLKPGLWKCQRYYEGALEPSYFTHVKLRCQINPAPIITGKYWAYPHSDEDKGGCYCQSGFHFSSELEWCVATPECPNGETPYMRNGRWMCLDLAKNAGLGNGCNSKQGIIGNPINALVGNKYQTETDYSGSGQFPLMVSRQYNSIAGHWTFFNALSSIKIWTPYDEVRLTRHNGQVLTFYPLNNNTWEADSDVLGTLIRDDDASGNTIGWRYTTISNQVEKYDAQGRITKIINRNGLSHTYTYTNTDITVTDDSGNALIYSLDSNGLITGFSDPKKNIYSYSYDSKGNLASLTYPNNGGARTYHYEDTTRGFNLTGITDANGDRYATWHYDTHGRAISSEHAGGVDKVTIDYTHIEDASDPRVTTTNALGKQTTYHFTTIHGVRKVTQVEGHPSNNCAAANKAYTYDANGFLATKTDWKGNVTRYTRNAKGQELTRTEAEGTPEERTVTTEWHGLFNKPTKITESDRVTTLTYDSFGNETSRKVVEKP